LWRFHWSVVPIRMRGPTRARNLSETPFRVGLIEKSRAQIKRLLLENMGESIESIEDVDVEMRD
jgi:hypothetical protein